MRRHLAQAFMLIGVLTIIVWLLNLLLTLLLPAGYSQKIILFVGVLVALLGAISGIKDTIELFHIVSGQQADTKTRSSDRPQSPFNRFISAYMNTRILKMSERKTSRLFSNDLFVTVGHIYSDGLEISIGSPGFVNQSIKIARLGDSFIYKGRRLYDVRVAEIARFGSSAKLIITRTDIEADTPKRIGTARKRNKSVTTASRL